MTTLAQRQSTRYSKWEPLLHLRNEIRPKPNRGILHQSILAPSAPDPLTRARAARSGRLQPRPSPWGPWSDVTVCLLSLPVLARPSPLPSSGLTLPASHAPPPPRGPLPIVGTAAIRPKIPLRSRMTTARPVSRQIRPAWLMRPLVVCFCQVIVVRAHRCSSSSQVLHPPTLSSCLPETVRLRTRYYQSASRRLSSKSPPSVMSHPLMRLCALPPSTCMPSIRQEQSSTRRSGLALCLALCPLDLPSL